MSFVHFQCGHHFLWGHIPTYGILLYANIFRYCLLWNCMIIKVGNACQLPQGSRENRFWRQRLWRQESGKLHNNHILELNVQLVSACWYIVTCKWVTPFLSYSPIVFFPSYMIYVKPLFLQPFRLYRPRSCTSSFTHQCILWACQCA